MTAIFDMIYIGRSIGEKVISQMLDSIFRILAPNR